MNISKNKREEIDVLKRTAIELYKSGKTVREVGAILKKSHTWVWLIIKPKKDRKTTVRKRSPRERFQAFNYSSLRRYPGEKIKYEDWVEYTRTWPKRCLCCTSKKPTDGFVIDHIVHYTKGGRHELENLQLLCLRCNSVKGTNSWDFRHNIPMLSEEDYHNGLDKDLTSSQ